MGPKTPHRSVWLEIASNIESFEAVDYNKMLTSGKYVTRESVPTFSVNTEEFVPASSSQRLFLWAVQVSIKTENRLFPSTNRSGRSSDSQEYNESM